MRSTYRCANCGAKLHPEGDETEMHCAFCGTVTPRAGARESSPPPPPVARERRARHGPSTGLEGASERKKRRRNDLFVPIYVGAIFVVAGGLWLFDYLRTPRRWTGRPVVMDVDGDGVEDVLGQWDARVHEHDTHVVGLIDGASHRIKWNFTLDADRGARSMHPMAFGGGLVVVGTSKPIAEVLDARTGKQLATVDLPDLALQIFIHDDRAWIDTSNGKDLVIELPSGRVTTKASDTALDARPAWAPFDAYQTCPHAICRSAGEAPKIPDMDVIEVRVDGDEDDAIAVGRKENGTHLPMLAGFSLSTHTLAWSHVFSSPDKSDGAAPTRATIAHGRVYFAYREGRTRHLAAVGVGTGEVLWDVTPEDLRDVDAIAVGANVYVAHDDLLDVLDAKTGAKRATLP